MKPKIVLIFIVLILVGLGVYLFFQRSYHKNEGDELNKIGLGNMKISSSVFGNNEKIPAKYTCDGGNVSPPLEFGDVPQDAQSLVLISDDPDAPAGTWTHWTLWNIDSATKKIEENSVPSGAIEGTTSFGNPGYGGPCPPSGTHRYFFKVYALDTKLDLRTGASAGELESAMEGHILDSAEFFGLYSREY